MARKTFLLTYVNSKESDYFGVGIPAHSLFTCKNVLGPRKYTNFKFTALLTKLREVWEVFGGNLEGKQSIYFSPLVILSSYVSDIQINCQTLL